MTEFVTILPALSADGRTPRRVPMPGGLGLPGVGSPLPPEGARVPRTEFVSRLIADGDAVVSGASTSAAPAAVNAGATVSSGGGVTSGGTAQAAAGAVSAGAAPPVSSGGSATSTTTSTGSAA